jgi:Ca2+-binding EF-hand superfamily protein
MAGTIDWRRVALRTGVLAGVLALGVAGGLAWSAQERPPFRPDALPPLLAALDADRNGAISADELRGAPAALRGLDRNGSGALEPDEVRPAFGRGGRRGGGDEPGETAPTSPDELVTTLMAFDRDADGRLSRSEVPDRMQGLFARADGDKDGVLTAEELKAVAATPSGDRGGRRVRDGEPGRVGEPGRDGEPGGEGRRGRGPGGPMRDPVFQALDANHDGTIAGDEIAAATAALAVLDGNGDGQLTLEEIRPAFGRGPGRF